MAEPDGERLAKILGMLGSSHDGERAAAAGLADRLVRDLGLTWADVVAGKLAPFAADLAFALEHVEALTRWEREFLARSRAIDLFRRGNSISSIGSSPR